MKATAKKPTATSVWLIHGDDEYQTDEHARRLVRELLPPEAQTLGLETIDGRCDTVAEALQKLRHCREAVQSPDLLGGRKVVWLRQAAFFGADPIGKSKDVRESLDLLATGIVRGLPPAHTLLITTPLIAADTALYEACRDHGQVVAYALLKPWQREKQALQFAAAACRAAGLRAETDALTLFVQKVGADPRQLRQEIDKLVVYLDPRRDVRPPDIAAIVSGTREWIHWDLQDAVGARQLGEALRILRHLLFQKAEPVPLVIALEQRFKVLLALREALDRRWIRPAGRDLDKSGLPEESRALYTLAVAGERGRLHPYVELKLAEQAAPFTRPQLERALEAILKTHEKLVSSDTPPALLLEVLLLKVCR